MRTLFEFVTEHVVRGACTCGRCADAPENPEDAQPVGHTVDLTFFKVAVKGEPDSEEFRRLVVPHMPEKEVNYLQLGGDVGDQGFALQLMGLGHLLGVWRVRSPETELGFMDEKFKQDLAGMGMVTIELLTDGEVNETLQVE